MDKPSSGEPGPGLRERKKARQRELILEAGIALFRERGYEATTVDDIARRAEISPPTFYNYFGSKDALLREFALTGSSEALAKLSQVSSSAEHCLRMYFCVLAHFITTERALWYAVAVSNAFNPVRDPELLRSEESGTRALEDIIMRGQAGGELTREFSAIQLASVLEGVMLRAVVEWSADFPEPHALADSFAISLAFFMRGSAVR